jgi:hypothetical protein
LTLHEEQYTSLITSRSVLLIMRKFWDITCREIETFYAQYFFFLENRAVYEIMWTNSVEPDRPQMSLWHMHIACWIPEATYTHYEYVLLFAFPLQERLHERASMLLYRTLPVLFPVDSFMSATTTSLLQPLYAQYSKL